MTTRMLIDARHREETRVAVVTGNRIEELDFESAEHKQLKGNIYLAKVTRVEPSLQAAFVDYGGNRHGFLAFAEIHPDYYQIPKEDREKLLAEEAEAAAEEAALREQEEDEDGEAAEIIKSDASRDEDSDFIEVDSDDNVDTFDSEQGESPDLDSEDEDESEEDESESGDSDDRKGRSRNNRRRRGSGQGKDSGRGGKAKASDEVRAKRMNLRRRYKIQDVIHRRQVLLVQVVKEERGNKGAALTTYMSLAGRYCVLMPNTSHGGGISRKISNASDRKRLKSIIAEMKLPATMGCIVRTAGLARTKTEIKRDFDYLARLWDEIRERTLSGSAPMLIHTDSDLIKRAIRDIYNRDISDVIVEGDEGFKAAKNFMKLLMPSHAKRVNQHTETVPLFQRYNVEDQLSAMYQPVVQLKSGGYLVINPTEALVSIDINSGRSTKEHGIEQTALATNLEAAKEIARQLRLRDMAGLVVIDFIDMERHGNSRKVERAMKDALKNDRARIQVGRISSFGLMEMSRQRLRTGVLEASTRQCPHCEGTGLVRTASSSALSALRLIEEEAASGRGSLVQLQASQEATIYVLNNKRAELADIEDRYGVTITVVPNGEIEGAKQTVSSSGPRPTKRVVPLAPIAEIEDDDDDIFEDEIEERDDEEEAREENHDEARGDGRKSKRRRGRRGGRGRMRDRDGEPSEDRGDKSEETSEADGAPDTEGAEPDTDKPKSRRRQRGGRKQVRPSDENAEAERGEEAPSAELAASEVPAPSEEPAKAEKPKRKSRAKAVDAVVTAETAEKPAKPTRKPAASSKAKKADSVVNDAKSQPVTSAKEAADDQPTDKPEPKKRASRAKKAGAASPDVSAETAESEDKKAGGGRKGWWQKTFG